PSSVGKRISKSVLKTPFTNPMPGNCNAPPNFFNKRVAAPPSSSFLREMFQSSFIVLLLTCSRHGSSFMLDRRQYQNHTNRHHYSHKDHQQDHLIRPDRPPGPIQDPILGPIHSSRP